MIDDALKNELKAKLEEEKVRLEKDLSRFAKKDEKVEGNYNTRFKDMGDDEDDSVQEVEAFDTNLGLEKTLEGSLAHVLKALKKMEEGGYGVCERCNKEIKEERLKVQPSAMICVECA